MFCFVKITWECDKIMQMVSPFQFLRGWHPCLTLPIFNVLKRDGMASHFCVFIKDMTKQDKRRRRQSLSFLHFPFLALPLLPPWEEKLREEKLSTVSGLGGILLPIQRTNSGWFQNLCRFYFKITPEMVPPWFLVLCLYLCGGL